MKMREESVKMREREQEHISYLCTKYIRVSKSEASLRRLCSFGIDIPTLSPMAK